MTQLITITARYNTIFIGMDVHKNSVSLCAFAKDENRFIAEHQIKTPDYHEGVLKFIQNAQGMYDLDAHVVCCYEAGCTGFALYRFLRSKDVQCVVVAPNSIQENTRRRTKTDRLDARKLAKSLAFGSFSEVSVPCQEDESVRSYLRMRDDHKQHQKKTKQQILSFCLARNLKFQGKNPWTQAHIKWLDALGSGKQKSDLNALERETLQEYMETFRDLSEKIARFEKRIAEISQQPRYKENVRKLRAFRSIDTLTAMTVLSEIGDFTRFKTAGEFASYLGLVPGEDSSGEKSRKLSITKAGNSHVRRVLTESAQCFSRGKSGHKSKKLIARQKDCSEDVIKYADHASNRLVKKHAALTYRGKAKNVATTAVARELACFLWGMIRGKNTLRQPGLRPTVPVDASPHPDKDCPELQGAAPLDSRGKPLSLLSKKEVSPEPPSRKKPRGAAPGGKAGEDGKAKN